MRPVEYETGCALTDARLQETRRREFSGRSVEHREQTCRSTYWRRCCSSRRADRARPETLRRRPAQPARRALRKRRRERLRPSKPAHEAFVGDRRRAPFARLRRGPDRPARVRASELAAANEMGEEPRGLGDRTKNAGEPSGRVDGKKGVEMRADLKRSGHEPSPFFAPLRPSGSSPLATIGAFASKRKLT